MWYIAQLVASKVTYPKYFKPSNGSCTFAVFGQIGRQGSIERILPFFMMDIGEYHADIQRNCEAISPDVRSTEGDIDRQFR